MGYTDKARELRRCKETTKAGKLCRQYALWGWDVCVSHSERQHRGPMGQGQPAELVGNHARYTPCTCPAYAWPHRPGGGLCRWPDPPERTSSMPAGPRLYRVRVRPRWRRPKTR